MIHAQGPFIVASLLVGLGVMGVLTRRNAVLLLVGIELILSGSLILLVTAGALGQDQWSATSVLALFTLTIAAAEVVLALAVILLVYRERGRIDVDQGSEQ